MLFYRGIAVPEAEAHETADYIRREGMTTQPGMYKSDHYKPDPLLIDHPNLRTELTRPKGLGTLALFACGNKAGAHYYAHFHNRTESDDTPLAIEFDSDITNVAIDGRDFLFTVLQSGDPVRAQPFIREIFGEKGLWYAEKAWKTNNPTTRIAIGDLMIHDQEVIESHYANKRLIHGRSKTRFTSAFTVSLPIPPSAIREVSILDDVQMFSGDFVSLDDVRAR
ncbi:hypothetical protein [Agrobacterium rosae]|uniref:hypothetical protein n=1 Tax=Agrobacterium rosae TaxID=1972867 RepID=UPI003A8090B3